MIVLGVVDASGCGAGRSRGENWTAMFTLDAWRIEGGDVRTTPLLLRRSCTDDELAKLTEAVEAYAVVRLEVTLDPENESAAALETFLGTASDPELDEHATRMQAPVYFSDPLLGDFTLDRRVGWFEVQVVWEEASIPLRLFATEQPALGEALKVAHALVADQAGWGKRAREHAVEKLLALKNEIWLEEGEEECTAKDFRERIRLEAITVSPDGSFELWFDDDELFWGHAIEVQGDLSRGPTDADVSH